jgi:hypothetical protein
VKFSPEPGREAPASRRQLPAYFLWQHAEPLQQAEPLQHPASADFPNEVPNVSNKRAVRLNTHVVIFFMTILLQEFLFQYEKTLVTRENPPHQKMFSLACF